MASCAEVSMSVRCCRSRVIDSLGRGEDIMLAFGVVTSFYAFATDEVYFVFKDLGKLIFHFNEVEQGVAGGFVEVNKDVDVAGLGVEVVA